MKHSFYQVLLFIVTAYTAHAQDVLVKKNGMEIKGKVIEVGIDKVTYKINLETNSANFVIRKSELSQIEFGNGETVFVNTPGNPRRTKPPGTNMDEAFGRSMINFSPFKVLDTGPGIGISYELLVDKRQYIGIVLPISILFPDSYAFSNGTSNAGNNYFYFSPGVKIYPFGQKKVTYSVGPNIFTGFGKVRDYNNNYDPITNTYTTNNGTSKNFRFGIIVNNYVNFQITEHFQIGLNGGLGSRYIDRKTFNGRVNSSNIQVTGEFNFNLGLRF